MAAKVISFINYKGGVGKTTTTYHIGCALALKHGKRVLLVDVDPQTNLSFYCAIPERWQTFRDKNGTIASLYEAHLNRKPFTLSSVVWKTPIEKAGAVVVPGVDLIPSDVELLGIDLELQGAGSGNFQDLHAAAQGYIAQRFILKTALQEIISDYDYILIDCPPNLYLVTQNALAASEKYVVTALPDHLSTVGLTILERKLGQLQEQLRLASQLRGISYQPAALGGIIFVRVRMGGTMITNLHQRTIDNITRSHTGLCFERYTTEGIAYGQSSELALPVYLVGDTNARRVAEQYEAITEEFLSKV